MNWDPATAGVREASKRTQYAAEALQLLRGLDAAVLVSIVASGEQEFVRVAKETYWINGFTMLSLHDFRSMYRALKLHAAQKYARECARHEAMDRGRTTMTPDEQRREYEQAVQEGRKPNYYQ